MASLTRTFQRSASGDADPERIRSILEREAQAFFNAPVSVDRKELDAQTVEWTFTTDQPFPLQHRGQDHTDDIGFSDMIRRVLGTEQTKAPQMADRTGARSLSSSLRDALARIKAEVNDANSQINDGITQMTDSVAQAKGIAKEVKTEAAELQAALGQLTNGAPE